MKIRNLSLRMPNKNKSKSKSVKPNIPKKHKNKSKQRQNFKPQKMLVAPVSVTRVFKKTDPVLSNLKNGAIRIKHREYVGQVSGHNSVLGAFWTQKIAINPGNAELSPWGSKMAQMFDSYKYNKLRFTLATRVPTTCIGNVMMYVDGDIADPSPVSEASLLQNERAISRPGWLGSDGTVTLDVQKEILQRLPKYNVSANSSNNEETDMVGSVTFGNSCYYTGASTGLHIADIFIEYDLELYNPTTNIAPSYSSSSAAATYSATGTFENTTGAATIFGGTYNLKTNGIGAKIINQLGSATLTQITWTRPGTYLVLLSVNTESNGIYIKGLPSGSYPSANGFCIPAAPPLVAGLSFTDADNITYTDMISTSIAQTTRPNNRDATLVPVFATGDTALNPMTNADSCNNYVSSAVYTTKGNGAATLGFRKLITTGALASNFTWKLIITEVSNGFDYLY